MSEEQIDAHALLDELREMLEINANVDWAVADAADEFKTLLEYVDRRRPVTDVHIGIELYKGLINEVRASKTDLEDTSKYNALTKDDLYDEVRDTGWVQHRVLLEE